MSYNSPAKGNSWGRLAYGSATEGVIDLGLRQYMLQGTRFVAAGLSLTGTFVAYAASATGLYQQIAGTPLMWVVLLAPLAAVLLLAFRVEHMSAGAAQATFWGYAALMGLSLGGIFLTYTGASVARVFFISAADFRRDQSLRLHHPTRLVAIRIFPVHGPDRRLACEPGQHISSVSSAMQFVISVIGVLVFTGLTAWDTQRVKEVYLESDPSDVLTKKALMGALVLYLDFINLFVLLLQFAGQRR